MKKIIVAGIVAVGMSFAASGAAYAGNIRDCVVQKAGEQLTEGQAALVAAHGDGEVNAVSVARDNGLDLADIAKVHGFMWAAGTACALGK
ncbi:MAG TPA: hypothetical protein ENJ90_02675 [Devosia sp.]|nr:hypothetical protein [Devosia sp.]